MYLSPFSDGTPWARLTEYNSLSNTASSPEATFVTPTEFILNIEA
jgi:hypothetical protein